MARWRLWPAETETLLVWLLCSGVKVTVDRRLQEQNTEKTVRLSDTCCPICRICAHQLWPHLCWRMPINSAWPGTPTWALLSTMPKSERSMHSELKMWCRPHIYHIISLNNCMCRIISINDPSVLCTIFEMSWFMFVFHRLILEFDLRTKEESGLLLYMARINHADFVSIQVSLPCCLS